MSNRGSLAARELNLLSQYVFQEMLYEECSQHLLQGLVMYRLAE